MMRPEVKSLIDRGAIFYASHSGGKDSQAMYGYLRSVVPDSQIVLVNADLGEVEWEGTIDHIKANTVHPVNVVKAKKTLLGMVEKRFNDRPSVPSWPSAQYRQCTSDLKRGPIQKFIRNDMKARGATLGVNVMGIRAEESSARSKMKAFKPNKELSKAGRTVHDWFPIHEWLEQEVFDYIASLGQEAHWAYAAGNKRLSCVFCIMGCGGDLKNGAKHRPKLAAKYIELERKTGYSMFHKETLESKLKGIPITVEPVQRGLALEANGDKHYL